MRYLTLLVALLVIWATANAEKDPILETAEQHARLLTKGLPGTVTITVDPLDPRTQLPQCSTLEAFTPAGSRTMGRTTIGVRCLAPHAWSVLLSVYIAVTGKYLSTARPLVAGQTLQTGDILVVSGDLAGQPPGVITDPQFAIGKTLKNSLGAGQPLRGDQLLAPFVIRQGQSVRVISRGEGFTASGEGRALNNAAEGQIAQVRMASGQVISGAARADGSIEVNY